jgi:hypothetical protein
LIASLNEELTEALIRLDLPRTISLKNNNSYFGGCLGCKKFAQIIVQLILPYQKRKNIEYNFLLPQRAPKPR